MTFKKWLERRSKSKEPAILSVDDLIILKRWDEAEKRLKERLRKNSRDVASSLKLAKVYERTRRLREAVEQYIYVADRYAGDGFYDKATAILAKAQKLAPMESTVQLKLVRVDRMRQLERRLSGVMQTLSKSEGQVGTAATASYLELRRVWGELSVSGLIDRLNDEQLGRLLNAMELVRLGRGKIIVERGQELEELYLLTQGKIEAVVELPNGETTVLRGLEPGDLVGERALLEHKPWPATFRTSEAVVVLRLDRPGLEAALKGNPDPRQLLDTLREQKLDVEVASAVERTLKA